MADVDRSNEYLKAFIDGKPVAVGEKGTGKVHVGGLTPNTDYAKGHIKVAFDKAGEVKKTATTSDLFDDDAFKTKPISVTGVTLNSSSLSVETGKTGQLTATVAPANATNKAVSWSSDNTDVVTVDNTGKVTAVKAGTANITVKTTDGAKSAKCVVTVKNASVPVTGISLDKAEASVEEEATTQLTATVTPSNATNNVVTWKSENEATATVDSTGKVTGVAAGTVNIIATTVDGAKTAQCALTVTAKKA